MLEIPAPIIQLALYPQLSPVRYLGPPTLHQPPHGAFKLHLCLQRDQRQEVLMLVHLRAVRCQRAQLADLHPQDGACLLVLQLLLVFALSP
jgi:hypothetical protein